MLNRKNKLLLKKIVSMFSVIRGYNIPVIALAQYLGAIFILSPPEMPALKVLLDSNLFLLVLASSIAIASGYIINNFYDSEKDLINRPRKSMLDRLVSQKTKLYVYFSANFVAVFVGWLVSWRVALFYAVYIFVIWFYSHKLKKYPIIGNLTACLLAVAPFFGILLYFGKLDPHSMFRANQLEIIISHAAFLFLLLLIREMTKDLENLRGDFATDYKTIPVVYGENTSKTIITVLCLLTVVPVYALIELFDVGYMDIYFYMCLTFLLFFVIFLWRSDRRKQFLALHNWLKFIIVAGVFCIVLIEPSVLWHGKKILLSGM
ncbi:geranylgeranylglycerol-phosphate geranylgeranyltransferase [Flavobacterium sp.]|uniref:geranylgeranylglycerol-phosphate geranylgeranyltransferase n=1 Tax=Flavobacterium sp. TaxID=239 RepID=UPI001206A434|nr:geranylgeranylglycerol-phosphate geranylgeranyltransferase [Flavobacterium sp.]RZJ71573.1 MAG: ubiquinone biosynthesis protein UbiA [Flavobacterium sp.]